MKTSLRGWINLCLTVSYSLTIFLNQCDYGRVAAEKSADQFLVYWLYMTPLRRGLISTADKNRSHPMTRICPTRKKSGTAAKIMSEF